MRTTPAAPRAFRSILWLTLWSSVALSFVFPTTTTLSRTLPPSRIWSSPNDGAGGSEADDGSSTPPPTNQIVQKIAVLGATGRTGSRVVQELLDRQVPVVALVRSADKANEVFGNADGDGKNPLLQVIPCDLTNESQVTQAVQGCDAAIWCATGFSDAKTTLLERIKRLMGMALTPKQSVDCVGIPILAKAMLNQGVGRKPRNNISLPQVVMLSSAGVTRPSWDEKKKEKYRGCADIPIVRLNPFGILDVKAESEEALRQSGT